MKLCLLFLVFFLAVSCGRNNDINSYPAGKCVLLESGDKTELSDYVESISVVPLKITEDWKYMIYPSLSMSDELLVMFDPKFYRLMAYDRQEYNLLFSKDVKGRGRGELTTPGNLFLLSSDTICLYDQGTGMISMYDKTGNYVGTLNNNEIIVADYVYPFQDNLLAISQSGRSRNNRDYVSCYTMSGKLLDSQLKIPDAIYDCGVYSGDLPTCYTFNDTLRFIMPFTYNLFSSTSTNLECIYLFETSKTMPPKLFKESDDIVETIGKIMKGGYVWNINGLAETDNYLTFSFLEGQKQKKAIIDKRNDKVIINSVETNRHYDALSPVNIWRYVLSRANIVFADNDYMYATVPCKSFDVLSAAKDLLDSRLEEYLDSYQAFKNNNGHLADNETCLIVKIRFK